MPLETDCPEPIVFLNQCFAMLIKVQKPMVQKRTLDTFAKLLEEIKNSI